MGFKKIHQEIGFAELALSSSMEKNRNGGNPVSGRISMPVRHGR